MVPEIEPEVAENMRSWPHSGFHVDQSVFLAAGDRAGIERVMNYMTISTCSKRPSEDHRHIPAQGGCVYLLKFTPNWLYPASLPFLHTLHKV